MSSRSPPEPLTLGLYSHFRNLFIITATARGCSGGAGRQAPGRSVRQGCAEPLLAAVVAAGCPQSRDRPAPPPAPRLTDSPRGRPPGSGAPAPLCACAGVEGAGRLRLARSSLGLAPPTPPLICVRGEERGDYMSRHAAQGCWGCSGGAPPRGACWEL